SFEGLYDLHNKRVELYRGDERFASLDEGDKLFGSNPVYAQVLDDIELLADAGNEFSEQAILDGDLTPVFFGSALTT
ncbi:peptide chain release factor 3, partial [Streptococcus suis]